MLNNQLNQEWLFFLEYEKEKKPQKSRKRGGQEIKGCP